MKKTATTIRCVPRYGYEGTDVRTIDLDLADSADEPELAKAVGKWFDERGIADAVYDITVDDDGFFAVINDEVYAAAWGTRLV